MTNEPTPILDHGYLQLIERWGSDQSIVEGARMSTDKGFLGWGPIRFCPDHDDEVSTAPGYPNGGSPVWACPKCGKWSERPGDEKLLAYLWKNAHSTPFEMAGLTIEVQAPVLVFREWHRHRVPFGYSELCLAGDTEITCIGSGGLTRHYTIEHIYRMKHEGVLDHHPEKLPLPHARVANGYSKAGNAVLRDRRSRGQRDHWRVRQLPSCQHRTLRVLDEQTETYTTAAMHDVWQSGMKEIWLVKTPQGRMVKASADHPFFTREGWKKVSDLRPGDRVAANGLVAAMERPVPPILRRGIGTWASMMRSRLIADKDSCYVCGEEFSYEDLELDHVVPVISDLKLALDEANLRPICGACHTIKTGGEQKLRQAKTKLGVRWIELHARPVRIGEEMTYDISVEGPHHNFVANGLVVHNSARYTPMPNLNYLPTLERCMVGSDGKNKQAGTVKGAPELTESMAQMWRAKVDKFYDDAEQLYQFGLGIGMPKELARVVVPVGRYSRMRATGNLRGWLGFLKLRNHPTAQYEIRVFAQEVAAVIAREFPRTHRVVSET